MIHVNMNRQITTGADQQTQIARMRAVAIARHVLHTVPSRPEELENQDRTRRVSIVSGGMGQVRVRLQEGSAWISANDVPVTQAEPGPATNTPWYAAFIAVLDGWFGGVPVETKATPATVWPNRPIRDNPQA